MIIYFAITCVILGLLAGVLIVVGVQMTKDVGKKVMSPPKMEPVTEEEILKTLNENRDADDEFTA